MTALLGIDLGGTWTRIARIDHTGGSFIRFPTPSGLKASQELTHQIKNLLHTVGEGFHITNNIRPQILLLVQMDEAIPCSVSLF